MPSDATQIALHMRRLEQRIAALERKETGSGGGGGGLDFDDITGLTPVSPSLATGDEFAIYDVSAGAARKTTTDALSAAALAYLLANDGAGSGLDADLLDGLDSTAFAAASHNHSASDITSGTIDDARIPSGIARDSEVAASYSPLGHSHSASDITSGTIDNARLNMGSGSGLDADTVDGGHFSEGTWTPSLTFGGGSTGMTYDTNVHGRYTRIGNSVFFSIRFNLTAKGSSTGDATVSLPITATSAATNMVWMCTGFGANLSLTTNAVFSPALVAGGTTILLGQQVGGSNRSNLTHAHFANNSQIRISGYYEV